MLDGVDESDSNEDDDKEEDDKEEDALVEDGKNEDALVEDPKDKEAQKTPTPSKSDAVIKRTSNRGRPVGASSKKGCSPPINCIFNCIF